MATTGMNWLDMWFDDKTSIIESMRRNMVADLEAGYDPNGHSIRKQIVDIEEYQMRFNREAEALKMMTPPAANHWCYIDLKKRGAIL